MSEHSVGNEISCWWEWWDGDILRCGTGSGIIIASSRSSKRISKEAALERLQALGEQTASVRILEMRRVIKDDIANGEVDDDGSLYNMNGTGAGWIDVAVPGGPITSVGLR